MVKKLVLNETTKKKGNFSFLMSFNPNFDVKHFSFITLLYSVFTLVLTYPLFFNLSSSIFGYTSDNFPSTWSFWAAKLATPDGVINLVRYPLGEKLVGQIEIGWSLPFSLVSQLLGEIVTFNVFTLLGFIFSGVSMYYFVRYLVKDKKISFLIGLVYAFAPYHFWQGFAHFSLGLLYTLPLYFLVLLNFDEKRTPKWGVVLGVSFVFTFLTSLYLGFFTILATICYFLIQILVGILKRKNYLSLSIVKSGLVSVVSVGLLILPIVYYLLSKNIFEVIGGVPKRPISDLLSLSMRPWDFILPTPNHPLWGKFSNTLLTIIESKSNDFKTVSAFLPERVNYVGLSTLIIAFVGFFFVVKKRENRKIVLVISLLIIALLLLSAPPFIIIHGVTIKFPTYWLYPFLTFYRVYARMGILVLLFLLVLTSLGLKAALKNSKVKNIFLVVFGLLIFIEFLPFGWNQNTNLRNQPVYDWLKTQPDKIIAEYPPDFDLADGVIWQMYHGKKLYNDFYGNEVIPIKTELGNLYDPKTWEKLQAVGVDLVVFHTKYLYEKPHPISDFYINEYADAPFTESSTSAQVVKKFDNAIVYKPAARNAKVVYVNGKNKIYTWLYNENWLWSEIENTVYIYNSTSLPMQTKVEYELVGSLSSQKLNNEDFKNNDIISLKSGLNSLVFTRSLKDSSLEIKNFKLVLP